MHGFASSQSAAGQQFAIGEKTHLCVVVLHESAVHTVPSAQSPFDVQHPVIFVELQVCDPVSHESAVHGSLSLQPASVVQHPPIGA